MGVGRYALASYIITAGIILSAVRYGPEIYRRYARSTQQTGSLVVKELDEKAVSRLMVPRDLKDKLKYFDFDTDGDLESYIAWENKVRPDPYLLMERVRGKFGTVSFPKLSKRAVTPVEEPARWVDYLDVEKAEGMESVIYVLDTSYMHNPGSSGTESTLKPLIIERLKTGYSCREIDANDGPPSYPKHMRDGRFLTMRSPAPGKRVK